MASTRFVLPPAATVPVAPLAIDSHAPLVTLAVYASEASPVLLTATVWFAGFAPPLFAVTLGEAGLTPIVGAGLTVSATLVDCGVLDALGSVTAIDPLNDPEASA